DGTHSNLVQRQATVTCPTFEYDVWKNIATSGGSDTHYYTWSSGTSFQENGGGTPQTFRAITDNPARTGGLYFFDTTNGFQPIDGDADGFYDNLTPEIQIQGGTWGSVGFLYVNAVSIQTRGVGGRPSTWAAPGEPYADADQNGLFDAGERWVNLQYPTTLGGDFIVDETNYLQNDGTVGATAVRNTRGPSFTEDANVWGILFNSGQFEATGNGTFFGSVVAESGIGENSPAAGTPQFYWDESILSDWPPSNWNMPRVAISRWETDLRD
ncbi:MAG: hypothetical protein OER88_12910, partial [Planctomycetota bacterium]|nr:hypothetical protein [Planctomycetota bacterium]